MHCLKPWVPALSKEGETNNFEFKVNWIFKITFGIKESLPGEIEGETEKSGVVSQMSVQIPLFSLLHSILH